MSDNIKIRLFNNSIRDVDIIKNSFENNLLPKDIDKLKWLYLNGINGPMKACMAFKDEDLAALYALFPVEFKIQNKLVNGLQSLDTLTDENYRGLGLFKKLSKASYEKGVELNYNFVYGFPNGNSAHGFFNKLGWNELGEVPFLILPNNINYFLKKIPIISKVEKLLPVIRLFNGKVKNNNSIKSISKFNNDSTDLWNKFSEKHVVGVNRNAKYLNWRFIDKPNEEYQIKGYYCKNVLEGFIVYTSKKKHGGNIGYIMELIYNPNDPKIAKKLLKFAKNELVVNKIDVCLAWCFKHSESYKIFKSQSFLKMPKFLRPIELHFGYKQLNSEDCRILNSLENWYLSYADSDTV